MAVHVPLGMKGAGPIAAFFVPERVGFLAECGEYSCECGEVLCAGQQGAQGPPSPGTLGGGLFDSAKLPFELGNGQQNHGWAAVRACARRGALLKLNNQLAHFAQRKSLA